MNDILNDLLLEALNSETKAKEFYLDAAKKAKSDAGKKFFTELSEFEQNHYEKVKKIIESLNEGCKIEDINPPQTIAMIKPEIQGEIEPNKDEITTVINLAIESEKDAQERYTKIAQLVEDETGKEIFTNLAQDESNHQRILEHQFYQMSNKGTIIWE